MRHARTADPVLRAIADPTRRTILERIRESPVTVGELAEELPVSQPAVSQHLGHLREAGLVRMEKRGRRHIYHLEADGFRALRAWLDTFWSDALEAYGRSFEADGGTTPGKRNR